MATTDGNEAPRDVEIGKRQTPAVDPPAPPTVLEQARLGNLDLFRTELETGNYPLDFKAGRAVYFNRTPLHLAAMEGHHEIVEFILSRPEISREVVNAKDRFGYTPLHLAVRQSHESVVQLLTTSSLVLPDRFLAATSEPDDLGLDCGGCTPLHLAAMRGDTAIAKLLVRQPRQVEFAYDPVNLHAVTWSGKTPLDAAEERFYPRFSDKIFLRSILYLFPYDRVRRQNYLTLVQSLALSDLHWLQQYRESTAMSANAILVGAALVVAASFGSWLQPPGGIPVPRSGSPSSSPSAFGSADKYWNSVFYACVAFSFSFAVVALMIGTVVTSPGSELSSVNEVMRLRKAVETAQLCLFLAVTFLLFCFSFAGSLVLRNFAVLYGTSTYYGVTWLPVIVSVYVVFVVGFWALNMHREYGMRRRVTLVFGALFYVLIFAVIRVMEK